MDINIYETLSEATDALTKEGYKEGFKAIGDKIVGLYSHKEYRVEEIKIVKAYRFENNTDPGDDMELFALQAADGSRGTLVMSYSASDSQNVELIRKLETL
jgi:hypothetical protein